MQSGGCRQTKHEKTTSGSHIFLNFQINRRSEREREKKIISMWIKNVEN
jgi:hypothetical protein